MHFLSSAFAVPLPNPLSIYFALRMLARIIATPFVRDSGLDRLTTYAPDGPDVRLLSLTLEQLRQLGDVGRDGPN